MRELGVGLCEGGIQRLELARLLMEANGGSLDIESPSTLGSLVRLRLPRVTRAPFIRPATA